MTAISLKQVRRLADFVVLRTTTDPATSSPIVSQLVTNPLTFGSTDRFSVATSVPGRFDSGIRSASVSLFGATSAGSVTATLGYSGGPSNTNGLVSWTPFSTAFNNDFGHFSLITTRTNTSGWDPVQNSSTRTGASGALLQYVYFSAEAQTASPGSAFLGQNQTYYDPVSGRAKLFIRYGSPEYGYAESPSWEPALVYHSRDQSGTVRVETVATYQKADLRYAPISPSPFAGSGTQGPVPDPGASSSPYPRYLLETGDWVSPTTLVREQWYDAWGYQSPAVTFSAPVMVPSVDITIRRAYLIAYSSLESPSLAMSFALQSRSPVAGSSTTNLSSPVPFAGSTPVSPQVPYELNVSDINVDANQIVQFASLPASPGVGIDNLLLHIEYVERRP